MVHFLHFILICLRVFLADALIRTVGFHANINQEIDSTEPGEIAGDVNVDPTKSLSDITYSNSNVKIKAGDTVYYWIYVQHNFLGYRFPGKWVVTGNFCNTFFPQRQFSLKRYGEKT